MRVLITGVKGLLGRFLIEKLENDHEVLATYRTKFTYPTHDEFVWRCPPHVKLRDWDVRNFQRGVVLFDEAKPDVVIHCAAYTNVDRCKGSPNAYNINVGGTTNVATLAKIHKARMIFISTDYVFDGEYNRPLNECDQPNPIQDYGVTKHIGEQIVEKILGRFNHTIIRSSWLYGWQKFDILERDFPQRIAAAVKSGNRSFYEVPQVSTPTYAGDLAKAIRKVVVNPDLCGLFHITNEGRCTRKEWINFITDNCSDVVLSFDKVEVEPDVKRPKFSALSCSRWRWLTKSQLPHWRESMRHYMAMIKHNQ